MNIDNLVFYIGDSEDSIYLVVNFGSEDEFYSISCEYCLTQWECIGGPDDGHMMLNDRGSPFTSIADAIETLIEDFSEAIADGATTADKLKSQVKICSGGIPMGIL